MATRNIVPRATGEGSLGTSAKHWGNIYADNGTIAGRNIANDGVMLATHEAEITNLQSQVTTLEHAYAGAKAAATVADMTDHEQIYVYVGSETGYTNGNWYYWNGTAWTSGGVYQATAVETDKTLTVSGAVADAKVVGDKFIEANTLTGIGVFEEAMPVSFSYSYGWCGGNVGSVISVGSQNYWEHTVVPCIAGNKYRIKTYAKADSSEKYAYFTDADEVIISSNLNGLAQAAYLDDTIIAPLGASKLYVKSARGDFKYIEIYESSRVSLTNAMLDIEETIGEPFFEQDETYTLSTVGGFSGSVGDTIVIDSSTYWRYTSIGCNENDVFDITTHRASNTNTGYYCSFTDANNVVIGTMIEPVSVIDTVTVRVKAPAGASKLYVKSFESTNPVGKIVKLKKISIHEKISDMKFDDIPDYYKTHIAEKATNIIRHTEYDNGISFIFGTDFHFPDNALNSKALMKYILDNTSVPFALLGGDYPGAYGTETDCKNAGDILLSYMGYIGKHRVFSIRGNHDFTIKDNASSATGFTLPYGGAYNYIIRNSEFYVDSIRNGKMYYYIDIPASNTRIIMLNSSDGQSDNQATPWGVYYRVTQSQVDWLLNDALNVENKKIIFISHIPADPSLNSYDSSQDVFHAIAKALCNKTNLSYSSSSITATKDFTNTTNTFICHISGHGHHDGSNVDDNVLSIETTCDAAYGDDGHGTIIGTVTEQAFDNFCINYDTRTINAIRVGRGNDRSWTY